MKKMVVVAVLALGLVLMSIPAFATPLSVFNGWTMLANDDGVGTHEFVDPGWGGQAFDAEYLFYQFNAAKTVLSIGLQTGFDVVDGQQTYNGSEYYAGDLALSFDDCGDNWEYGVDFGWHQEDYYPNSGDDPNNDLTAGLYAVTAWNSEIYFSSAAPFAIATVNGSKLANITTTYGSETTTDSIALVDGTSYYRTVSFVIPDGMDIQNIAAHWTMSCGNDVVEGCAPVPEPQTLLLMGIGLLGLAFAGRKKLGKRS